MSTSADLLTDPGLAIDMVGGLVLTIEAGRPPIVDTTDSDDIGEPAAWLDIHRDALHEVVIEHGAVLVRGLGVRDPVTAGSAAAILLGDLMTEREGFAPRESHPGGLYSGSRWDAGEPMCPHNELSYASACPQLMLIACARAPEWGGGTVLADSRQVLAELPPGLVDEFAEHGWQLRRRYNELLGLSLAEAFGSDSREAVERYCGANQIEFDWEPDGTLRTLQHRPAVVRHPVTGEYTWCNQIAFLNAWTLDSDIRDYLIAVHGPDGLPFDTARGDGKAIGPDVVDVLNEAYQRAAVCEPWQAGDLLLFDNVRMAHGQEPYRGERDVLVAMGRPVRLAAP